MSSRRRSVTAKFPDISMFRAYINRNNLKNNFERKTYDEPISAAIISATNNMVYATTAKGNLFFIDFEELVLIDTMTGIHKAPSRGICLSKSNDFLVTGSADKSINIIDIKSKQIKLKKVDAHINMVVSVHLLKNDSLICSSAYDPESKIWNVDKLECIQVILNPEKANFNMAVCLKDFSHIIYGDFAHNLNIYNLEKNNFVITLKNHHSSTIQALALSPDEEDIWTGSPDLYLKKYNLKQNKVVLAIPYANSSHIWSIAVPNSKSFVASAGWDLTVNIFHYESGEKLCSLENIHEGFIQSILIYNSDNYLLTCSLDMSICKFVLGTADILERDTDTHKLGIMGMDVSENNKYLVAGSMDHILVVYDLETLKVLHKWEKAVTSFIRSIRIAQDNKHVIVGSSDRSIGVYDLEQFVRVAYIPNAMENNVFTVDIMKNMTCFASGSYDHSIKIWDFKQFTEVKHIQKAHDHFVLCVKFSYDNKYLISSSFDRSIKMWSINNWECVEHFRDVHNAPINSVTITNCNKFIITGSDDNNVKIFSVFKKRVVHVFKGIFTIGVRCVDISVDNHLIVAGSFDSTVQMFSLRSRKHMYSMRAHEDMVFQTKFSYNMKHIYSVSMDKQIIKWNNPFYSERISLTWFNAISPTSVLGVYLIQRLLQSDTEEKLQIISKFPNLFVYPFGWNLFHIISIFLPKKIFIHACLENKIPFILDVNKKTPLHYLLSNTNRELISLNYLLGKFHLLEYTKDTKVKIIKSLKDVFYELLTLDSHESAYFLSLCTQVPPESNPEDVDGFGQIKSDESQAFFTQKSLKFTKETMNNLVKLNGNDQYSIRVIPFKWNYDPTSDDITTLVNQLKKNKHEDIFRIKMVTTLISYLWFQTKQIHYLLMIFYSIWMIILSIAAGEEVINDYLSIVNIAFAAFFSIYETISTFGRARKLAEIFNRVTYYFIFCSFVVIYIKTEDDIAVSWLISFSVFFGYLKWISFFRVLDNTRKFIRMLLKIVSEMRSFLFIVILVCFGFSFIFYKLADDGTSYSQNLLIIYGMLYTAFDSSKVSGNQMFFFVLVTFFLGVVMLNMVVALMADKYQEVNLKLAYYENREKLSLIREALAFKRSLKKIYKCVFRKREELSQPGYLFFAEKAHEEGDDLFKLESYNIQANLKEIKNTLKEYSKNANESKEFYERAIYDRFRGIENKIDALKTNIDQIKGSLMMMNPFISPRVNYRVSGIANVSLGDVDNPSLK